MSFVIVLTILMLIVGWLGRGYFKIRYDSLTEARTYEPLLDDDYKELLDKEIRNTDFLFFGCVILYILTLLIMGAGCVLYLDLFNLASAL